MQTMPKICVKRLGYFGTIIGTLYCFIATKYKAGRNRKRFIFCTPACKAENKQKYGVGIANRQRRSKQYFLIEKILKQ